MKLSGYFREIPQALLRTYPKFREWETRQKQRSKKPEPVPPPFEDTPESRIETAYAEWSVSTEAQLLQLVRDAPPQFLERVVRDLLIKMGYGGGDETRGVVTGGPGDGGIDGMIGQDALGVDKIYYQAKRYGEGAKVRPAEIQQFIGALVQKGTNKGIFVTTSDFTDNAKEVAAGGQYNIVLISGEELARHMLLHDVGIREGATYEVKRIDLDYFQTGAPDVAVRQPINAEPSDAGSLPPSSIKPLS